MFHFYSHFWHQMFLFLLHQPIFQISGHHMGVRRFNSVFTLSTQSRCRPRGYKDSIPQDCLRSEARPRLTLSPIHFVTRFASSLEWLTELRKTLFLLLPVCYHVCTTGRATWERCTGQGEWGGHGASMLFLGVLPCSTLTCSPAMRLLAPCHLDVWRSHCIDIVE